MSLKDFAIPFAASFSAAPATFAVATAVGYQYHMDILEILKGDEVYDYYHKSVIQTYIGATYLSLLAFSVIDQEITSLALNLWIVSIVIFISWMFWVARFFYYLKWTHNVRRPIPFWFSTIMIAIFGAIFAAIFLNQVYDMLALSENECNVRPLPRFSR